jgi:hypothetical protein
MALVARDGNTCPRVSTVFPLWHKGFRAFTAKRLAAQRFRENAERDF